MARILVVDGNPENVKSLHGLLHYRTDHEFECVTTQQEGARKAISLAPDLIMMNVLLFMKKNYAFPRVLQQNERTKHISFLVHANGHLDEVTVKQIQASGVAKMIFLPASAQELEVGIEEALSLSKPTQTQGVSTVSWRQASPSELKQKVEHKSTPKAVKNVQWPTAHKNEKVVNKATRRKKTSTNQTTSKVFSAQTSKPKFRSASFERVEDVPDAKDHEFKRIVWEKIDPQKLKKQK